MAVWRIKFVAGGPVKERGELSSPSRGACWVQVDAPYVASAPLQETWQRERERTGELGDRCQGKEGASLAHLCFEMGFLLNLLRGLYIRSKFKGKDSSC